MSTIQNEMILEDLYDEKIADLTVRGMGLLFSKKEIEEMAELLATEQFESMWYLMPFSIGHFYWESGQPFSNS